MAEAERYQHYLVLRREDGSLWELGRGAMGITYKAYDTNLRCPVALKVINNAYLTSEVARQRFLREARAAAALRHQNVASVFHLGTDHESYFYAMEFIDGETVDVYMKRKGPLDPAEALLITLQVSRALAAAAKQNLVHRDLKPANLMLVDEEGEMVVKVIDFGLAKSAKREGDDSGTLTVGGGFVGTPHFASPEQLEERDIDIRSDIYSLGATLYYMIAGRPPYSGSVAQIMSQHLYKPLPLEPLRGTAPCVVELIQKMMEKDRAKRPNSPAELRRDLFNCLEQIQASASAAARIGILRTVTEQPDTLATLALGSVPPEFLATGVTVAGRYQITHELGEIPQGHQYVAEDLQKGRRVGMLVFNSEFLADKQRYTLLEQEVEQLRRAGQPQIQEIYSLESVGQTSFLVTEYVAGPQLVEVLRVRSVLTPPEALLLLRFLAPVADHAQANRLQQVDLTVSGVRLFAAGLNDMPADTVLLQKPLTQWLGLCVKVAPIDFSLSPADPVTWAGAATLVKSPSAGGSRGSYLRMLSLLIYELLGGPRSAVESTGRYKPISALSEEGNSILRRGLVDDLGSSAEMARLLEGQIFLRGSESAAAAAAPPVTTMRTDGFPSHSAQSSSGSSSVPESPAPPTAPAKAQPPLPPSESSAPPPPPLVEISLVMPASTPEKRKISTAGVFLVGVLALLIAGGLGFLIYAVIEIMPATRPGVSVSPAPVPTVSPSALPKKSVTPVPHPSALQTPEPRTTISPQPQESITPSSTPEERPTVEPSRSPEQVRSPEPSPSAPSATPEIDDYQKQLGEAQEMVRQGDWQGALKSYLDLADRYPDRRAALTRIDNLLAELRNTDGKIDPAAYPQLKPYFVRAAEKGVVPAMLILGKFSRDAEPSEAMKWYENAAAKGSVPAMIEAGLLYSNRRQPGDDRKALEHFLHAASIGDRVGKYLAGECYYFGKGVQADTTKGVEFLQEAAALREPRAMDLLGTYYRRLRQFDQARKFYEDAAAAGYALSLSNLGVLYMNGEGVQRSPELAANLFKQGAEKGESSGMFFYANCLQDGLGVPKDLKAAADWFRRSAHAGNQRAIEWCRQNGISYK